MNKRWNAVSATLLLATACGGAAKEQSSPVATQEAGVTPGAVDASSPDSETTLSNGPDASADAAPPGYVTTPLGTTAVNKLDVLFMIDNSPSMGDKQVLLADAVPDMLNRLLTPTCVGPDGTVSGTATQAGVCPAGSAPEFPPVRDMHIGIVSSSLGGRGGAGATGTVYAQGDECNPAADNTVAVPGLTPQHNNDQGRLLNRAGEDEHTVANASPDNYLAWFPTVGANQGGTTAPQPAVTTAGTAIQITVADVTLIPLPDDTTLIGAFQDMIVGVHEQGCGYEAQLESWYRFLIEPNPYASIVYSSASVPVASYQGVDQTIIQQRAAFLRPDSVVAVIVVTDENHSAGDPLSLSGTGWAFENITFPFSPGWNAGYGAAEGTEICATNPLDPGCVSCATLTPADRAAQCANQNDAGGNPIYYVPEMYDIPNLRFFHERQRFGADYHYPPSRYVNGLTSATVPDQSYDPGVACTNPLFAAALPTNTNAELCSLPPNTLSGRLPGGNRVYYAAITGVPHQLLQSTPGDGTCPPTTAAADCPQKPLLTPADWTLILGQDPINYNFTGVDFHMLESWSPRTQAVAQAAGAANFSNCPPTAPDNCDPINGREYDTTYLQAGYSDLEYACTFQLPVPKNCDLPQYYGACDCLASAPDAGIFAPPNSGSSLCQKNPDGTYSDTQLYGKAYPAIDELYVAEQMGQYGIVSSLCPIHTVETSAPDPLYGYRPAIAAVVDRVKTALQASCPPPALTLNAAGIVDSCLLLATFNDGTATCDPTQGYTDVTYSGVLAEFKANQHSDWVENGSVGQDPSTELTCELGALPAAGGQCEVPTGGAAGYQGWCYVNNVGLAASDAGAACPYQIVFANGGPPKDVTVNLTCAAGTNQLK
jgi:hypothetical protein